ncbi:hypothetical protein HanHA300_Chr01g0019111 [Helianthus annuus]|nr:hypothetical protein HanHA300_Chr01g0019111 [Helianthus annuus]KAJ0783372.1 hypothetical protein HanLR1_Chr01g0019621 [Helianthus annuus]
MAYNIAIQFSLFRAHVVSLITENKHETAPRSHISSTAFWLLESIARMATNSSTRILWLILSKSTLTAPSRTALVLFSWTIHKLKIADAASFIANACPSSRSSINGLNPPAFPITNLLESSADNVKSVAAALVLVSIVPNLNASNKTGTTFTVSTTGFLLLS